MHNHCGCHDCYMTERRMEYEMRYRMEREIDYRVRDELRRLQYGVMPQITMAVDFGKIDEDVTVVRQQYVGADSVLPVPGGKWDIEALQKLLTSGEPEKASKKMNVVKRIKSLSLSKEDKLLRKYQIVDDSGDLTATGKDALWAILLEANKASLVSKLTELEADEKKKR